MHQRAKRRAFFNLIRSTTGAQPDEREGAPLTRFAAASRSNRRPKSENLGHPTGTSETLVEKVDDGNYRIGKSHLSQRPFFSFAFFWETCERSGALCIAVVVLVMLLVISLSEPSKRSLVGTIAQIRRHSFG